MCASQDHSGAGVAVEVRLRDPPRPRSARNLIAAVTLLDGRAGRLPSGCGFGQVAPPPRRRSQLWWPKGEQPLYTLRIELCDGAGG